MKVVNARGTICAGRMEHPCRIRMAGEKQMVVHLERSANISGALIVVDHNHGMAAEARILTAKGPELTLELSGRHSLSGLVPARLSRARDLWKRGSDPA